MEENIIQEPQKSKSKIWVISTFIILIIILSFILAYFLHNSLFQKEKVSLEEIKNLEEQINDAERIPDYELLINIYTKLLSKIDKLEIDENQLYKLKGHSLEEYKRIKKEQYEKKLEFYKSVPNLIDEQITQIKSNISLMSNNVEKAFYTRDLARLYINKKDYSSAEKTLDEAYNLIKNREETDFFQKFYEERVLQDGTVVPASSSVFTVRDVKKRIFNTYWDLWKIKGIKEAKSQEIKVKLETNPNDYDSFMFLEEYQHHDTKINYSLMLQYYLYVDSLTNNVSYQYYLDSMISQSYNEIGDYQGQQAFLQANSRGDIISDIQIAQTYASQGDLVKAKEYIENLYPDSNKDTCWYKAHFYNSLAFKSSNGYSPMNNTYFEISNTYFEDCKKYGLYSVYQLDYYLAENYFWMGDKSKSKQIFNKIIQNSDNAQEIANAEKFIEDHQL